jgi:phosphatidylinositol glycan class T
MLFCADDVLKAMTLHPSIPRMRPSVLQLHIEIPPQSQVQVRVPFTKEYIRYTEHLPDASRGWELPPAIVFLPEEAGQIADTNASFSSHAQGFNHGRRTRLYTSKLLVDLPTPDFSMPYNVIIMTSTLIALFFGSIVNLGVRRWGVVSLEEKLDSEEIKREEVDL